MPAAKKPGAQRRSQPAPLTRGTTNLRIALVLILVTAGVYAPVRHYGFLGYDDPTYVSQNPLVKAGLTRDGIVWAWTGVHQATWHPLTTLEVGVSTGQGYKGDRRS